MKTITKFEAIDGTEFNKEQDCVDYEKLIERVNNIMNVLPNISEYPNPAFCFQSGSGFLQHDKVKLRDAQVKILKLCKEYITNEWIEESINNNVHPSYVEKVLDDTDDYRIFPLMRAWWRFMRIDKLSREWGHPYYASHPEKGEQRLINN